MNTWFGAWRISFSSKTDLSIHLHFILQTRCSVLAGLVLTEARAPIWSTPSHVTVLLVGREQRAIKVCIDILDTDIYLLQFITQFWFVRTRFIYEKILHSAFRISRKMKLAYNICNIVQTQDSHTHILVFLNLVKKKGYEVSQWISEELSQVFLFLSNMMLMKPFPDNKVYGANMGPAWGRQDPGGIHVSPMNLAFWVSNALKQATTGLEFTSWKLLQKS